jgi:hypothetical protein
LIAGEAAVARRQLFEGACDGEAGAAQALKRKAGRAKPLRNPVSCHVAGSCGKLRGSAFSSFSDLKFLTILVCPLHLGCKSILCETQQWVKVY